MKKQCKTCDHGSREYALKAPFNKLSCNQPITEGQTIPKSDPYLTHFVKPDDVCSEWKERKK